METGLCPRCGSRVYFFPGSRSPYCNDCGWNLNEVYQGHHKHDRTFAWLVCGLAVLISVPVIIQNPWHGVLLLCGLLVLSSLLIFFIGQSKTTLRLKAARQTVAQKPGSDLSSAAPEAMPPRVAAYGEALRSIPLPRKVRLIWTARAAIWMLHLIAAALAFVAIRDLLLPKQRIFAFSGAVLPVLLLSVAVLMWCVVPIPLRKEPRLDLLVSGEIVMARMGAVSAGWWRGEPISFEFHDTNGRLIRSQSVNRGHPPVAGAYIPVFHDPQNPENCAPACALNYELVLPQSLRFPGRPWPF